MGKSSTTKGVTRIPPSRKGSFAGKREAEETLVKLADAKKQKKNDGAQLDVEKKHIKLKTQAKKKKELSESDDSSSNQEDEVINNSVEGKPPVKESAAQKENTSAKVEVSTNGTQMMKEGSSNDEDNSGNESESDEDNNEPPPIAATPKNIPAATAKKPEPSSRESGSNEFGDDDDNDDEEEEDEVEEEEVDDKDAPNEASGPKSECGAAEKKVESSPEDDNENSKGKDVEMVDAKPQENATNEADVKIIPETPISSEAQSTAGVKTIFIGNLPFDVERVDVENYFKSAGEVVDVRIAVDSEKKFKGFGHVDFATVEAAHKALELDRCILGGRRIKVDLARVRGAAQFTPRVSQSMNHDIRNKESEPSDKGSAIQVRRIFVRGFDKSQSEDEILNLLNEHFKDCGEIKKISIPTSNGSIKGIAYLEFKDDDGFNNALKLNRSELQCRKLIVEEAKPRNDRIVEERIYMTGFDRSVGEDKILSLVKWHFKNCGEITTVEVPKDHATGVLKGMVYMEFKNTDSFYNALKLDGSELQGHKLTVQVARPRNNPHSSGGTHFGGERFINGGGVGGYFAAGGFGYRY